MQAESWSEIPYLDYPEAAMKTWFSRHGAKPDRERKPMQLENCTQLEQQLYLIGQEIETQASLMPHYLTTRISLVLSEAANELQALRAKVKALQSRAEL